MDVTRKISKQTPVFSIIPVLLLFVSYMSFSQGLVNNGGFITVQSGGYLTIDGAAGNYLNTTGVADGSVDLDGEIIIRGNWTNDAAGGDVLINREAVGASDGWVRFNGTATQNIGGNRETYFEKVEINNSAAGDAITMGQNVNIEDECALTDGIVSTGAFYWILRSTTDAELSGYTSNCFINGNLRRYTANATDYVFPVGKSNAALDYHRADLYSSAMTGVAYLVVKVASITEAGDNIDSRLIATEDGTPYTDVLQTAEWQFIPNAVPGGNFGYRLYLANLGLVSPGDDNMFGILKRDDVSTDYDEWNSFEATTTIPAANAAGRTVASGYAQKIGFTAFSKTVVAKSLYPLPVELLSFTGKCTGNGIMLNWTTVSETNNDFFALEKSVDNSTWETLATILAAGNSNRLIDYDFFDPDGIAAYYRLKQTDYNGKETYFNPIYVDCQQNSGNGHSQYIVIGDENEFYILLDNYPEGQNISAILYDELGQVIVTDNVVITDDREIITIGKTGLRSAIYNLVIITGDRTQTTRVFIR
ncbi:MAG: hypothetical protein HY738_14910 [Bacteroidia bacterium]|nr:hypothetical protein [Bacteroidia bacterium]